MNEIIIKTTQHFSAHASLAAIGIKLKQVDLFGPVRQKVHIAIKTVKHPSIDKVYNGIIAILAGAHGQNLSPHLAQRMTILHYVRGIHRQLFDWSSVW